MIAIKNYNDLSSELKVLKIRLDYLEDKRTRLFDKTQPQASKAQEVMAKGEYENKFDRYMELLEPTLEEIDLINETIKNLEAKVKQIEEIIREMKDTEVRVFVMRFIDGEKVKKIARELNYSQENIYRILNEIYKKIQ